ncbi:ADP-ribosylglycohydrolase family protein [Levilactobacillus yonginensis]
MQNQTDKLKGVLYGQAIGDAMGMPGELWPVERIQRYFGGPITTFLDGPTTNEVAVNFTRGQYTDDTNQALVILEALMESNWVPETAVFGKHLLRWADAIDAFDQNILGPSSKAALLALKSGADAHPVTASALTNGCAMRIAPIGALFDTRHCQELVDMVCAVTQVTHSSDVAFAGAAMVAGAVTAAMDDLDWDDIVAFAMTASAAAKDYGVPTWSAAVVARLQIGLRLAWENADDPERFARLIYETVGTGTTISESVPAAVAIAYYTRDVQQCALFCANLGGDTDTIGAMATAICGAKNGYHSILPEWITLIDEENPEHRLLDYVVPMQSFRNSTLF